MKHPESAPESRARRAWLDRALTTSLGLGAVVAVPWLSGCATPPMEISVSERQILSALSERFPAQRRVLEVFDVRLASPRLRLLPQENRMMVGFDLGVQESLLTRRDFKGNLMFSSGLRFDAGESAIRLENVRRENIAIDGLPGLLASSVNRWGGWLAEELLDGLVVHRVDRESIDRAARLGLRPGAIRINSSGISVGLEPIRAQGT